VYEDDMVFIAIHTEHLAACIAKEAEAFIVSISISPSHLLDLVRIGMLSFPVLPTQGAF
jgi:hypothetical protein